MVSAKSRATTQDILGNPRNGNVNPAWRQNYSRLVELREALRTRQNRLALEAKDQLPSYSEHMGDAGTDQYDQDFALSMLSSDQDALCQIDEALNRIRDGTYGVCELTGEPIEPERLEAIPWTRFSLSAQKNLEEHGQGGLVHFAPRGAVAGASGADSDDGEEDERTEE